MKAVVCVHHVRVSLGVYPGGKAGGGFNHFILTSRGGLSATIILWLGYIYQCRLKFVNLQINNDVIYSGVKGVFKVTSLDKSFPSGSIRTFIYPNLWRTVSWQIFCLVIFWMSDGSSVRKEVVFEGRSTIERLFMNKRKPIQYFVVYRFSKWQLLFI